MNKTDRELRMDADRIRIGVLKGLRKSGAGHIGGSMSMAELLAVLYGGVMRVRPDQPDWEERDWLVVSKGHCGPALYATLALKRSWPLSGGSSCAKTVSGADIHISTANSTPMYFLYFIKTLLLCVLKHVNIWLQLLLYYSMINTF